MKVIIIDDFPLTRKGITAILQLEQNIELVGEASDVDTAINLIINQNPDIIMLDLRLGSESGLKIVERSNELGLRCKFIVLTSSIDEYDFTWAEGLGAKGYVLKEALPEEIILAINIVNQGRKYYDPGLMSIIMKQKSTIDHDKLTERENDVLAELGKGLSNREISKRLFITEHTVKKHVSQILAKLNMNDRTKAAIYANNTGLKKINIFKC